MYTLKPFRAWCQKVLPLVYDDSLSYYELLCKVLKHLNLTIEDVNELKQIVTGGVDIETIVEEQLDQMVEDGTMDAIIARVIGTLESGVDFTAYPVYDFSKLAKTTHDKYNDSILSQWNAQYTRAQWQGLCDTNRANMFYGNAWQVSGQTYAPYYVWKARRNYQTTHFGSRLNGRTKYGMYSNEDGGEPTILITMGQRGLDKLPNAMLLNLFQEWLKGNYNGEYILDTYNFIIVPMLNYTQYDAGTGDDLRNTFRNGYTNWEGYTQESLNIEEFLCSGVRSIMSQITTETISQNDFWRYAQNIVHFNIDVFTWSQGDDEDEFPYGILFRGHTIRENNSEGVMFNGCMAAIDQIKQYKPALYANQITSQVHIGNNSYHSIISCASQNGYKCINLELPARVGSAWNVVDYDERYPENSFFVAFTDFYNALTGAMKYLAKDFHRVYPDLWTLGFWVDLPGASVNAEGNLVGPYRAIDIDEVIKRVPPGSVCNFGIRQLYYNDGEDLLDMTKIYHNLPSSYTRTVDNVLEYYNGRGGMLSIDKGQGNEGLTSTIANRRGRAEYTPYYDGDRWFYCKVANDGSHKEWSRAQAKTSMEFCLAKCESATDVDTVSGTITQIPLTNYETNWSTVEYFGVSNGGVRIRKPGIYLISGGVQVKSIDEGCSRLTTYLTTSLDGTFNDANLFTGEAVPVGADTFAGGINVPPKLYEVTGERWIHLAVRSADGSAKIQRDGNNTYIQVLLVRETQTD